MILKLDDAAERFLVEWLVPSVVQHAKNAQNAMPKSDAATYIMVDSSLLKLDDAAERFLVEWLVPSVVKHAKNAQNAMPKSDAETYIMVDSSLLESLVKQKFPTYVRMYVRIWISTSLFTT